MSGLVTATVLARHFQNVLLLERDPLEEATRDRRGVPQGRHSHVLLASGSRVLESLFPGLCKELTAGGATSGDVGRNVRWFVEGALLPRFTSAIEGFGMSRAFLERAVRERVRQIPNITLRDDCKVTGLLVSHDSRRVAGVRCGNETLEAGLVVDAMGRGSRSPGWLTEIGFRAPVRENVGIELRYTTRLFTRRPQDLQGDNAFILPPTPLGKRGGGIISVEDNRWIVTLITHFGDYPPPELDGFREFARTLPASDIYDVIRDAEPLGEARTFHTTSSVRRRYEYLKRFPAGYLVVGDAISSFNPIYGQGMSVAALEALELDRILRRRPRDVARDFFRRAAKIVDAAWRISASNDLRMPEATGRRTLSSRLTNRYVAALLQAGHSDAVPARAFLRVSNLLAPPLSLVHPTVLRHVLLPRAWARRRAGIAKPEATRDSSFRGV